MFYPEDEKKSLVATSDTIEEIISPGESSRIQLNARIEKKYEIMFNELWSHMQSENPRFKVHRYHVFENMIEREYKEIFSQKNKGLPSVMNR